MVSFTVLPQECTMYSARGKLIPKPVAVPPSSYSRYSCSTTSSSSSSASCSLPLILSFSTSCFNVCWSLSFCCFCHLVASCSVGEGDYDWNNNTKIYKASTFATVVSRPSLPALGTPCVFCELTTWQLPSATPSLFGTGVAPRAVDKRVEVKGNNEFCTP